MYITMIMIIIIIIIIIINITITIVSAIMMVKDIKLTTITIYYVKIQPFSN